MHRNRFSDSSESTFDMTWQQDYRRALPKRQKRKQSVCSLKHVRPHATARRPTAVTPSSSSVDISAKTVVPGRSWRSWVMFAAHF